MKFYATLCFISYPHTMTHSVFKHGFFHYAQTIACCQQHHCLRLKICRKPRKRARPNIKALQIVTNIIRNRWNLVLINSNTLIRKQNNHKATRRRKFHTSKVSWAHVILQPAAKSLSIRHATWEGMTGDIEMDERVIAAASMKVPASIRSGGTIHSEPCNWFFPFM